MSSRWQTFCAQVPAPFRAALALGAGFFAFVAWDQSHWWRTKEDYGFGWLAPVFVLFVVHDRWPAIVAALDACRAPGTARAAGWRRILLGLVFAGVLPAGVGFFLLGAFYRAGAGASHPGTLAITLGACGIAFALLFLNAPGPAGAITPARLRADARVRLVGLFVFPVLVWLVSAPMVSLIEGQLNLFLLRRVVTVVAAVFDLVGIPIEQQGNVLALPNGTVGVEDACSGIRSLTGCLFAGSFLAAVFLERWWKKIFLVVAALLLAFLTNLVRSLFLTTWAYRNGPASINGTVHDAAGYAVLGLTVLGLLCLLPLLNLRFGDVKVSR
jgi:exosortase/archaeosortase family protein